MQTVTQAQAQEHAVDERQQGKENIKAKAPEIPACHATAQPFPQGLMGVGV